jgi:TonB family protein
MTSAIPRSRARSLPLGPTGPSVDENNMVFFGSVGGYGPKVYMDLVLAPQRYLEPKVDILAITEKMRPQGGAQAQLGFVNLVYSFLAHLAVVGSGLAIVALFSKSVLLKYEEEIPVEVNFGFDVPKHSVSTSAGKTAESEVDQKASKTEQQLPQLSKQIAVESAPPQEQNLPPPEEIVAKDEPPVKVSDTLTQKEEPKKETPILKKETPPPGVKAISAEELARRVERETRKVAKEEKKGSHKDDGKGRKQRPSDLPSSPFSDNKSVAEIPSLPSVLPQGSRDGSLSVSASSEYKSMALNHILRFWNLPDLARFEPGLKTEIEVTINAFGNLVGKPRVVKKSGESAFDEAALKVVLDAVPFPELSKELAPRLKLTMLFSPKDIKQ